MSLFSISDIMANANTCAIFRRIACVGDSLSSGELVAVDENGNYQYNDIFDYSWGQFIARETGAKVYNFSRGGMTAKEYIESFAEANGMWNSELKCQAYLIALGENDFFGLKQEIGSVSDIDRDDPEKNKPTFTGYYARIIQRYKKIQPRAMFFLISMPQGGSDNEEIARLRAEHSRIMNELAEFFDNTFVLDLYKYGPVYDKSFRDTYMMNGHMTPVGCIFSAKHILKLWNKVIDDNPEKFNDVAFIGTDLYSKRD